MSDFNKIQRLWEKSFNDAGIPQHLYAAYLQYIKLLTERDIPIIFEFDHLCRLLGRKKSYLASAINSPWNHYRTFKIPKRRGGFREINAPYPALLECQQWINSNILSKVNTHSSAHGFQKNKSIITNASAHLAQRCLLKADIKDFFPSITMPMVIRVFRRLGYTLNISIYLSKLCTLDNCLPQGAATSPSLSNIVSFGMDIRLSALANSYGINYTRYADDMAFSGYYIPHNIITIINSIIRDFKFILNPEKTSLSVGNSKKIVTGLSVNSESLKIPRAYKRKLRQEIHYIRKYGYASHAMKKKIRNPFYIDSLNGKIRFWLSIEPENKFALESASLLSKLLTTN